MNLKDVLDGNVQRMNQIDAEITALLQRVADLRAEKAQLTGDTTALQAFIASRGKP